MVFDKMRDSRIHFPEFDKSEKLETLNSLFKCEDEEASVIIFDIEAGLYDHVSLSKLDMIQTSCKEGLKYTKVFDEMYRKLSGGAPHEDYISYVLKAARIVGMLESRIKQGIRNNKIKSLGCMN